MSAPEPVEPEPERTLALAPALPEAVPAFPGYQEMQGMAAMAVTLSAAAAVPGAMRGKPNDVFLVLLTGRELGIPPTTAIRECHVIDGKVTISPKVKLAMVRQSGLGRVWPDASNDAEKATWHAERADQRGTTFSSTFTMDDARRTSGKNALVGKDNWKNYPQRMLSWRALGYLLDDVFSEVGTGLYSPDELGAMTDEDGRVIDVGQVDPLPGTAAPRSHNAAPPEPPASAEDLADIAKRVQAITAVPGARAALLELWSKPKENGSPTLPAPGDLLARHVRVARAMLEAVEKRMAKGEWVSEKSPEQRARAARAAQVAEEAGLDLSDHEGEAVVGAVGESHG